MNIKKSYDLITLPIMTSLKYCFGKIYRFFHTYFILKFFPSERIFTFVWKFNYWGSHESFSGPGSTLTYTRNIRSKLPQVINAYKIESIFDAPCGDFNWMQHFLKNSNISYIGADIVKELIYFNNQNYGSKKINFELIDITKQKFPKSDLWLCRAVFFHFSYADIIKSLHNFSKSKINYLLVTNNPTPRKHLNVDIKTGDWRLLNLTLPPFNFPKAIFEINDSVRGFPPSVLSLYSRKQVLKILRDLK